MADRDLVFAHLSSWRAELPEVWKQPYSGEVAYSFLAQFAEAGGELIDRATLFEFAAAGAIIEPGVCELVPELASTAEESVWNVEAGITTAAFGIAETGSLVITGDRRLSVTPPIHVAILSSSCVVATLEDALLRCAQGNVVFITGPSRTADIEGTLVHGVHGPERLLLHLI